MQVSSKEDLKPQVSLKLEQQERHKIDPRNITVRLQVFLGGFVGIKPPSFMRGFTKLTKIHREMPTKTGSISMVVT